MSGEKEAESNFGAKKKKDFLRVPHPEDGIWNPASKLLVSWIYPLIEIAAERPLLEADVWAIPSEFDITHVTNTLGEAFEKEKVRCQVDKQKKKPSLGWAIWNGFRANFLAAYFFQMLFCLGQLGQPYLIGELVAYIQTGKGGRGYGIGIALGMAGAALVSSVLFSAFIFHLRRQGIAIRNGLIMACYEQTLNLTSASRAQMTVGQATSLMAIDCEKVFMAAQFSGFLWHGPVAAFLVMILLIWEIGPVPALAGMLWICILIPSQQSIARAIGLIRREMIKCTDERGKLVNEILAAIRVIKLYSWEIPIVQRTLSMRSQELRHLSTYLNLSGALREVLYAAGPVAILIMFSISIYGLGTHMEIAQVFRVIALINILRFPLNLLGQALKQLNDARVSVARLDVFFLLPTVAPRKNWDDTAEAGMASVVVRGGTFSWGGPGSGKGDIESGHGQDVTSQAILQNKPRIVTGPSYFELRDVHLQVKAGELVAVVGAVGSGKSSLLNALLGEMPQTETEASKKGTSRREVRGRIAYCAQTPWIQNRTLRDNILFGNDYTAPGVAAAYHAALASAALLPDMAILSQGDLTEIGEKGINLSGGQKARVSVARALLRAHLGQASIVLLDDPFSAVDGETGNHIFHNGVRQLVRSPDDDQTGGEGGCLVLCCLNSHLHLLSHFSRVLIMKDGHIVANGSPEALLGEAESRSLLESVTGLEASALDSGVERARSSANTSAQSSRHSTPAITPSPSRSRLDQLSLTPGASTPERGQGQGLALVQESAEGNEVVVVKAEAVSVDLGEEEIGLDEDEDEENDGGVASRIRKGRLVEHDARSTGSTKWYVYLAYFSAAFWPRRQLTSDAIYRGSAAATIAECEGTGTGADMGNNKSDLKSRHGAGKYDAIAAEEQAEEAERQVRLISSLANPALGVSTISVLLLLFTIAQASRIGVDYCLAQWALQDGGASTSSWATAFYVDFGILILMLMLRSVYLNVLSVQSTGKIHVEIFLRIIQAPVTLFFDTHTVGEVLNKLARDTEIVDSQVPEFMLQFLINWFQVSFTIMLCVWSIPWIALGLPLLAYAFYALFGRFSAVSRDIKRLEGVTRSPIYSSLAETIAGLETIRAFGDTERFLRAHCSKMERNGKYFFHQWMITSWMTIRLEVCTGLVLGTVAVMAVLLRDSTSEIALGLALSYGIQLTALFQRCVQLTVDVSVFMTSLERILTYLTIPQERSVIATDKEMREEELAKGTGRSRARSRSWSGTSKDDNMDRALSSVPEDWPPRGLVEFRNVWFRYRKNPPVLKGISFTTRPGERIGVCGRTGAGKSSIMVALFRLGEIEPPPADYVCDMEKGRANNDGGGGDGNGGDNFGIFIDGLNLSSQVPLHLLRERLAIIPQDPVLFTGSIRFQLDPFSVYQDSQVQEALETVNMRETVEALPGGLEAPVKEGGSNLSQGQRQLICIARALLRNARVLVVDEGTSAVDPVTDDLIQIALRESSRKHGTTVLAIAHRLSTIKDFDRILVLDAGRIVEFDSPEVLLRDPQGRFTRMLSDSEQGEQQAEGMERRTV